MSKENRKISIKEQVNELHDILFQITLTSPFRYVDLVYTFTHILFIQAIEKLELTKPLYYTWEKLLVSSDMKQYVLYKVIPSLLESDDPNIKFYFQGLSRNIETVDDEILKKLVGLVEGIGILNISNKKRYEFLEYFLDKAAEKTARTGDTLNERAPKKLRTLMTSLLDPQLSDTVADLTCGTGAFLLDAAAYVDSSFQKNSQRYYGVDINSVMVGVAIMHSYISGLKNIYIEQKDLLQEFDPDYSPKCSKIYSHMPLGVKLRSKKINPVFSISSRNADIQFLDAVTMSLEEKGKAAVLVTGGMLSSRADGYRAIRAKILDTMRLEVVISLPGVLLNTNIPLFMFVFKNEAAQSDILFIDLHSKKSKNKISNKSIHEAVDFYQMYIDSGYDSAICMEKIQKEEVKNTVWFVPKNKIVESDYMLLPDLYKPHLEAEVLPIEDILHVMKNQLNDIVKEIDELQRSVSKINALSAETLVVKKLGDVCEIKQGRPLPRSVEVEEGVLPWVQIKDITKSNDFLLMETEKSISHKFAEDHKLTVVDKNALLLSVRGTIGTVAIAGKRVCIGPNVVALEVKNKQVNPWFLLGLFMKNKEIMAGQAYGTIPMISIGMLRNMDIAIPNLSEQDNHMEEYANAMQKLRHIKTLSENNYQQIDKMANSLFNQYFTPRGSWGDLADLFKGTLSFFSIFSSNKKETK